MAIVAEEVLYRLRAETGELIGPTRQAEAQFDRSMSSIEKSATRAERHIVKSNALIANANRNIARNLQDVGVQLGAGTNIFTVISQQAPQIADAMADLQGRAGKVAAFFTTPWAAAGLAAAAALTPLAANLFKTGNEVDELVEKMRKQARQAENNRLADEKWKGTIEGLTEAIRKRREEQERALETDIQAEERSRKEAAGELFKRQKQLREKERELIAAEREASRLSGAGGITGEGGDFASIEAAKRVRALREEVKKLRDALAAAQASLNGADIPIGERNVENRVDGVAEATDRYTRALGRLRDERQKGIITQQQFEKQLEAERRKRDAAIKTIEASRRPSTTDADTVPFGRPVIGGRVTGSFAEKRPGHNHGGVDIAVPVGTAVSATAPGTVIEAGNLPGYGNTVIIDHGRGTITRYAHLSQLIARKGEQVGAGDAIGLSGGAKGAPGAGNSRGPHLHYEVRRNGRPVNPNGAFPIDPATARTVRDKVKSDFDSLFDDLQRDADATTAKITSDFRSVEESLDPNVSAARKLAEEIQKIEDARLIGLVDDLRAAELQLKAMQRSSADVLGSIIGIEELRAAGALEQQELDEQERKRVDAEERLKDQQTRNIYELADLYESLFQGGTRGIWETFKAEGLRALALFAAQQTFKAITGSVGGGSGDTSALFATFAQSIFGRASGGYVGPGSIHRVNEHAGGVELLRMGPQGGQVIPLGAGAVASGPRNVTVIQNFTLDARQGITTPQLLRGVNSLVDQKAGQARDQAVQIARGVIPGDMAKAQRYR